MAGPIDISGICITQLPCHGIGIDGAACPVGLHHGNGRGGAADLGEGLPGAANGLLCPATVCLLKVRNIQGNGTIIVRQVLSTDPTGLRTAVKHPAPASGGFQEQNHLSVGQSPGLPVGGPRAASDIQIPAAGAHRHRRPLDNGDIIAVAVTVFPLGIFHAPPGAIFLHQSDIAALFQGGHHSRPGRRLAADVQTAAGCGHRPGLGTQCRGLSPWRKTQQAQQCQKQDRTFSNNTHLTK